MKATLVDWNQNAFDLHRDETLVSVAKVECLGAVSWVLQFCVGLHQKVRSPVVVVVLCWCLLVIAIPNHLRLMLG